MQLPEAPLVQLHQPADLVQNFQPEGTTAHFYYWDGQRLSSVFTSAAAKNPDLEGSGYSNHIDAIQVC